MREAQKIKVWRHLAGALRESQRTPDDTAGGPARRGAVTKTKQP
jgi:hypothetical protein